MCRRMIVNACAVFLVTGMSLPGGRSARGQYLLPVETPIEQALARVAGEKLTVVRVVAEQILETREETYTVTVKVARTVVDEVTKEQKTVYEDVPEMRTRIVTVARPVYKQLAMTFDVSGVAATELGGAKLDAAALKTRLAKQGLILIANLGEPAVPEQFQLLFKPETIVLDLGRSMPMAAPAPAAPALPMAPTDDPFAGPTPVVPAPAPVVEADFPKVADIPPQFRLASIDADGQFAFKAVATQKLTSTRQVPTTEKRDVGGKVELFTVIRPISVTERRDSSHTVTYPASVITGVTVDEKPMDDHHREALIQREIPVIVSADGKSVPSFWLQNLKPKMLVLTVPVANTPLPPGASPPVPAPKVLPAPMLVPPVPVPSPVRTRPARD